MIDDLRHYKAPLGAFQIVKRELAEFIIIVGTAIIFVVFIIPDIVHHFEKACR